MQLRRYRIWPALLVFGVLFALVAVAPQSVGATGLSVRGGTTTSGQKVFVLSGNGFGPGETITVTGIQNDGSTATFPNVTANAIGAFDSSVPYNSNVFRIKASGQLTAITALADVGPVFGTPPGFVPTYPTLGPCSYAYTYNTYCGFGYLPGYSPGYYAPGYSPSYYPGSAALPAPPVTGSAPATTTTTTTVPVPTSGTAPTNATTVPAGQAVSVPAGGFAAGENVTASVTAPNGQVTQIGSAPAANDGTVTITITFPSAGTWQVTAQGQTSGKSVVATYNVQ